MSTFNLRKTVKDHVNTADVRLLKMMKALAETYQSDETEVSLTEDQYKLIDGRRKDHLKGKSKSYSWDEVKYNARHSS